MPRTLKTQLFREQEEKVWPKSGRHILAQYDGHNIIVYQAFCREIARYAVSHGQFGGDKYSFTRMTWIRVNFLWMMYKSDWANKTNQERILAITISREGFDEILEHARGSGISQSEGPDDIRLQWDPDHDPKGGKVDRRVIELGLRGEMVRKFNDTWIQKIEDITDFVKEQRTFVLNDQLDKLVTPSEKVYIPASEDICCHILLEGYSDKKRKAKEKATEAVNILDGACCSELLEENIQTLMQTRLKEQSTKCTLKHREIILCFDGAFNPIHTRHIEVMVKSKKWIEDNTKYRVISGYLAVAPDEFVKRKCKKSNQKCISSEHRIEAAKIACSGIDWLNVYDQPVNSAGDCGKRVKFENKSKAEVAIIVGADRAMNEAGNAKWHKKNDKLTVCVGKKGESDMIKKAYVEDLKQGNAKNDNFLMIPYGFDNVSAAEVRKMLIHVRDAANDETRSKAMKDIVDLGWLNENVGDYLLKNSQDLYIN